MRLHPETITTLALAGWLMKPSDVDTVELMSRPRLELGGFGRQTQYSSYEGDGKRGLKQLKSSLTTQRAI